ncbi:MAG: hypothetical protein PHN57_03595 [Candidatus Omnitrophica bacterium]|nr:hypothetical protein [Candidatus Omnitrophota bacterium]
MKKQPKQWGPAAKLIITGILVFVAAYSLIVILGRTLKNLDYFKIREIIANETVPEDFSYLKGRNIFSLDLARESRYISGLYPGYKKIRLIRILPNQLFVDFIKRKPLAFIRLNNRYFYVDKEMAVWDPGVIPQDFGMAVILCSEARSYYSSKSRTLNIPALGFALYLVQESLTNKVLKDYKIKIIDIKNPNQISFLIYSQSQGQADLEVKISQEEAKRKIGILTGLLTQAKNDLANVQYIDLRFKEPVIKLKNAK